MQVTPEIRYNSDVEEYNVALRERVHSQARQMIEDARPKPQLDEPKPQLHITYYTRDVYGTELRYPVSAAAQLVCRLAGTKTLTDQALAELKNGGVSCTFEEVLKPRK